MCCMQIRCSGRAHQVGQILGSAARLCGADAGLARHNALGWNSDMAVAGALDFFVQIQACMGRYPLTRVSRQPLLSAAVL